VGTYNSRVVTTKKPGLQHKTVYGRRAIQCSKGQKKKRVRSKEIEGRALSTQFDGRVASSKTF
jgi:hypothetical protein